MQEDKKTLKKIQKLLDDICRNGHKGELASLLCVAVWCLSLWLLSLSKHRKHRCKITQYDSFLCYVLHAIRHLNVSNLLAAAIKYIYYH